MPGASLAPCTQRCTVFILSLASCRSGEHTSTPAQQTAAADHPRARFNTAAKPTRSRASESATPALQRARSPQARLQSHGSLGPNRSTRAGTPNSVYAQGTAAFFRRASSPQGSQVSLALTTQSEITDLYQSPALSLGTCTWVCTLHQIRAEVDPDWPLTKPRLSAPCLA